MNTDFTQAKLQILDDVASSYSLIGKGALAAARFIVKAGYRALYPSIDYETDFTHKHGLDALVDQTIFFGAAIGVVAYYNAHASQAHAAKAKSGQTVVYGAASAARQLQTAAATAHPAHRKKRSRSPKNKHHQQQRACQQYH